VLLATLIGSIVTLSPPVVGWQVSVCLCVRRTLAVHVLGVRRKHMRSTAAAAAADPARSVRTRRGFGRFRLQVH